MAQAPSRIQRMDATNRAIDLPIGQWKDRKEYDAWWMRNSLEHNRLAVTDRAEWERITKAIEAFHRRMT